ncbi:lipoyl synthase [bacterium]|nr:lipoyl synthase [bacterium]
MVKKPPWLKKKVMFGASFRNVRDVLKTCRLNTVCEEALCPNRGECYSMGTATFLILGDRCTRSCRFCAVDHGVPLPPDSSEPAHVAEAVVSLGLRYVVITSVTRDDLPDGGSCHFSATIKAIRQRSPQTRIEVLIPDFGGLDESLAAVMEACPDVLGHNIETVPGIYPIVRPGADYGRSLALMKRAHEYNGGIVIKSGLMLGLGETALEVRRVLADLVRADCSLLTLGQYLQPDEKLLPVQRFIPPREFDRWRNIALRMGFREAVCGPFVRSSYHAEEQFESVYRDS